MENKFCSKCGGKMIDFPQDENGENILGYNTETGKLRVKSLLACETNKSSLRSRQRFFKDICVENGYRDMLHDCIEIPN